VSCVEGIFIIPNAATTFVKWGKHSTWRTLFTSRIYLSRTGLGPQCWDVVPCELWLLPCYDALRPVYSDATQLNSTRRRVELCRYKRAFINYHIIITPAKAKVTRLGRFVRYCSVYHYVCVQIYCKSNFIDFIENWCYDRKNWLTLNFDSDPEPDTDSVWLFLLSRHCRIADFRRFINVSHRVAGRFSRYSTKWLMPTW